MQDIDFGIKLSEDNSTIECANIAEYKRSVLDSDLGRYETLGGISNETTMELLCLWAVKAIDRHYGFGKMEHTAAAGFNMRSDGVYGLFFVDKDGLWSDRWNKGCKIKIVADTPDRLNKILGYFNLKLVRFMDVDHEEYIEFNR